MKNIMPAILLQHYNNDNVDKNKHNENYDSEKKLNERIIQLEHELLYTKECLQASNEEHLVYDEKLQSINEEYQSSNDELQSINEEYQSTNDELLKLNTQYQYRNQELVDLYDDMTNYFYSTDIGIVFLDENLCIRKFTPSITKEINIKGQDIGRPLNDISNNLIDDDLYIGASEVLGSRKAYEKEIQSTNGSWYLLKCSPYCTAKNSIKGVVLSLVDITNKKLLDETVLSETLKSEFFANLSHELRTPLNVILSALQLLDTYTTCNDINDLKIKFKKYCCIMKQNCYRQLRLVNNIIDITKLDAGFFDLNLQNCNIVNIVESVTLSVAQYIKSKSLELIFDTDIEECIIACDSEKIERVILNVLANAIKFTKPNGDISVNMYDKGKDIIISIKDTGMGIPNDKLNIIFDRFKQVDRSLTRAHEGSGIGLSIVKSLVEMHKGTISVFSEYGKGTEFIIVLPVIVVPTENVLSGSFETDPQENIEKMHIEFSDIYSLNNVT